MATRTSQKMRSDERRHCILRAAKELFAQKGFLGVTTRQLAAAIGVTEPVIYEHFSSKRGLYDEVLLEESKLQMAEFVRLLAPHEQARDDEGFFRAAGEFLLNRDERDPAKLRFLLQVLLEGGDSARLFYRNQVLPTHQHICRYIETRMREGAFRAVDSRVATRQFIGFVAYHNSLQRLLDDQFMDGCEADVIGEVVRNFLSGLVRGK